MASKDDDSFDSLDGLPEDPEAQIKAINAAYRRDTPWIAKGSIKGGGDFVQNGFSATHFPLELLQNADDEGASDILFEYDSDRDQLRVFDDGDGFTKEGVVAVSQQGQSRKQSDKEIGFMGIGFKSLFEICERVEVHSNGYHFAFEMGEETADETVPGFLLPEWIDPAKAPNPQFTDESFGEDYETVIVGHTSADESDILPALRSDNLSPSVFLFLNSLERARVRSDIDIERTLGGQWQDALTHHDPAVTEAASLYLDALEEYDAVDDDTLQADVETPVQVREVSENGNEQSYIVFRNIWVLDDVPRPQFRDDLTHSELFAAFQFDENGLSDAGGSIRLSPVHSYLPLKTFDQTNIDFLVHADFDLVMNREDIRQRSPWNKEAIRHLREQVLQPVAWAIAHHDQWHNDFEVVVPDERSTDGLIHGQLLGEFTQHLKTTALFRPAGRDTPEFVASTDAAPVSKDVLESFSTTEIREATSEWPVPPSQHAALARLEAGRQDVVSVPDTVAELSTETLEQRSVEWFRELYLTFAQRAYQGDDAVGNDGEWDVSDVEDAFSNNIVLTEHQGLQQGVLADWKYDWRDEALRLPPEDGYESLADNAAELTPYGLVHSAVLSGEDGLLIRNFFHALGATVLSTAELLASATEEAIGEIQPERIIEAYATNEDVDSATKSWLQNVDLEEGTAQQLVEYIHETTAKRPDQLYKTIQEYTTRNWRQLSHETKRETLQYLQSISDTETADLGRINLLPNEAGEWKDPEKLVFPDAYEPRYEYETLQEKYPDVFDEHTEGFVDSSLSDADPTDWREFLRELGVCNSDAENHNIVATLSGYVGQEYVRRQLVEQGIAIDSTDTHGENTGKDLTDTEGNHYEVKSTVNSRHGGITIDGRQFEELERSRAQTYQYRVIAVVNALDESIAIQDNSTAKEIMAAKESIEYNPQETSDSL